MLQSSVQNGSPIDIGLRKEEVHEFPLCSVRVYSKAFHLLGAHAEVQCSCGCQFGRRGSTSCQPCSAAETSASVQMTEKEVSSAEHYLCIST